MLSIFIIVLFTIIAFVFGVVVAGRAEGGGAGPALFMLVSFVGAVVVALVLGILVLGDHSADRTTGVRLFFACIGYLAGLLLGNRL
ncbi:MAG TPA: hypothetical protein V6C81_18290 [Planktothrix sp.]|jgi:hypothetical protein